MPDRLKLKNLQPHSFVNLLLMQASVSFALLPNMQLQNVGISCTVIAFVSCLWLISAKAVRCAMYKKGKIIRSL